MMVDPNMLLAVLGLIAIYCNGRIDEIRAWLKAEATT